MIFGEKSEARRKANEWKNRIKALKKSLLEAGMDKPAVVKNLKELQEAVEEGAHQKTMYDEARTHLERAGRTIECLSEEMGDCSVEKLAGRVAGFAKELSRVTHVCLIREDDLDFISTRTYMESITVEKLKERSGLLMLRSELENLRAVFTDVLEWQAPDFFALAYYLGHESGEELKDLENEQRNQFLMDYLEEHFLLYFYKFCEQAGQKEEVQELIQNYIYGEVIWKEQV